LKTWLDKLLQQLEVDWGSTNSKSKSSSEFSDERATLLYILDVYNKHLFDIDSQPVRKVRETLDEFSKMLVKANDSEIESILFKLRQFFSAYRLDEYTYINKTFDEFKSIIWDFAEELGEDLKVEAAKDREIGASLNDLRTAVESNSIDVLKTKAREFIDFYVEVQTHRDERRSKRLTRVKKNLQTVKKKLMEAQRTMKMDHLTGAFNRMSFDEHLKNHLKLYELSKAPVSLISLDIDFFKKINDTYGHDIGDFVLKECVLVLQNIFNRKEDFVARVGGEEFAIILPDYRVEDAVRKAEEGLARIRREKFIHGNHEIKFTVSMGIAQLNPNETADQWMKRADQALYQSKNSGRNKYTIAEGHAALKTA
jgi:diguanylate cyclase (GGDEF)-like protein